MAGTEIAKRNEGARGDGTLVIEDARIQFRNFAGEERMYNREGDRNFCVLLDEDLAQQMIEDGWNIKRLKPREDDEIGTAYIQVSVGFKGKRGGPRMIMITSKGRLELGEDECVLLDWADILTADVIIRPYRWEVSGKTGIKAYLKTIAVTINEDYLELKYADVPLAELNSADSENNIKAIEATATALSSHMAEDQDAGDIYDAEIVD